MKSPFKTSFAKDIFRVKYAMDKTDTWADLAVRLVDDVCGTFQSDCTPLLPKDELIELAQAITDMKFIPGGRYLRYAGRPLHAWNNCFMLRAESDTREEWGALMQRVSGCLMTGGGIGVDYSILRPNGAKLQRTGGTSSGPMPLIDAVNYYGRGVMQGGNRRSAIYASLSWQHGDAESFLKSKDWHNMPIGKQKKRNGQPYTLWDAKQEDFNFPAPLDMTNISLNYDDAFLNHKGLPQMFVNNVRQALSSGEPGFSFNFGDKQNETLRNAPVSLDTWILTDKGYKQVREIRYNYIPVWTGKQYSPAQFVRTGVNVTTLVVTMTGGRQIKADPSHEFLVERWKGFGKKYRHIDRIDKVPAHALKKGDILHASLPHTTPFSDDTGLYTLGFIYGDGSFNMYGAEATLCTPEKKALLQHFDAAMIKSVTAPDSRGHTRVYFHKQTVGSTKGIYPYVPRNKQASFIAGLFDADGSYDHVQHRVRLSSVHKAFLETVRRKLEELGIQASVNKGSKCAYSGNNSYMLVVMADSVEKFKQMIPTKRVVPTEAGWKPYRMSRIKVESVTQGPVEDVYCCDVGVEEHSFCAEGVIISNCTELTSEDDSDVCNLGSLNMGRIETLAEFERLTYLASRFLVCGTVRADLPYEKVYNVREKNRRLGLGLMGIHEWLIRRNYKYEAVPELHLWLAAWRHQSEAGAGDLCDALSISKPKGYRAIAPTGTISILASTTSGIEPLYAVAYKRRYLADGVWKYAYVVDSTADHLIKTYGVSPESIETAADLALDPERRIAFQADVQGYVDHAISSTINLPAWGTDSNNEDKVKDFAHILHKYAPRLRGFTAYPDGARGGQPLTQVPYEDALKHEGVEYVEADICDITGKGGTCGS